MSIIATLVVFWHSWCKFGTIQNLGRIVLLSKLRCVANFAKFTQLYAGHHLKSPTLIIILAHFAFQIRYMVRASEWNILKANAHIYLNLNIRDVSSHSMHFLFNSIKMAYIKEIIHTTAANIDVIPYFISFCDLITRDCSYPHPNLVGSEGCRSF